MIDIAKKKQQGKQIIEAAEKFMQLVDEFNHMTDKEREELFAISENNEEIKELQKDLNRVAKQLPDYCG